MSHELKALAQLLTTIAGLIVDNTDIDTDVFLMLLKKPKLAIDIVLLMQAPENYVDEKDLIQAPFYLACIFTLDICVTQLQSAIESDSHFAEKILQQLMNCIARAIDADTYALEFWLPVLNIFYSLHLELIPTLRDAYLECIYRDEQSQSDQHISPINAVQSIITELSGLTAFEIAENFFAHSYAMPADFFVDLVVDLCSLSEGKDIALLMLLHPKQEVRDVVVGTLAQLMDTIVLSSVSLSRLRVIKQWYEPNFQAEFDRWIKLQRKKGVVFQSLTAATLVCVKASEVDGSGAQGIFIHAKTNKKNRICGLLFKQNLGIKDTWITPFISNQEVGKYYNEIFEERVSLRRVDKAYLHLMANHFLALSINNGFMPSLYLMEIEELLGEHFQQRLLDINQVMAQLSVQIMPFTPEIMQSSFKRSKHWLNKKKFTESWYIENTHVDKLVNQCSSFVDGVKVCALNKAVPLVLNDELETNRGSWQFLFLWTALWAKACGRRNEKIWQDSFLIAYAIHSGTRLTAIPLMTAIGYETVINSIETMNERQTHLH